MSSATTHLTERQQIALEFEALVSRRTPAAIRRQALADYCDGLLADPDIQQLVRDVLRYRREHGIHRPVTTLRSIR